MVTGAYARSSSSIATGSRAGSATRRSRSAGVLARCQIDAPIALHVVSMPAMSRRPMVRPTWNGSSFCPSSSASRRNVMRSSRGLAMWSLMWPSR